MILFSDVKPLPALRNKDDYPDVTIWSKKDYTRANAKSDKGASNGEQCEQIPKAKVGRPRNEEQPTGSANSFLQNSDGTRVNADQLKALSVTARVAWISLMERDWAPPSFCRISHEAWEFFASVVLNEAELDFLLLCDDGKWKLREWSKQNYSSWAGSVGLREKNIGAKKGNATAEEKVAVDALDHPDLIRMKTDNELESNDEPEPVIGSNSGEGGGVEASMACLRHWQIEQCSGA